MNDIVRFCSIGLGGNSMEYGGGCSGSWYLHTPQEIAKHYRDKLRKGVLLLDKRPVVEYRPECAFASRMLDVDMADNDVDRFASRYISDPVNEALISTIKEGGFGSIIRSIIRAAEIANEVAPNIQGPLDYVPISTYVQWWVTRGAILYRYDGEEFVRIDAE